MNHSRARRLPLEPDRVPGLETAQVLTRLFGRLHVRSRHFNREDPREHLAIGEIVVVRRRGLRRRRPDRQGHEQPDRHTHPASTHAMPPGRVEGPPPYSLDRPRNVHFLIKLRGGRRPITDRRQRQRPRRPSPAQIRRRRRLAVGVVALLAIATTYLVLAATVFAPVDRHGAGLDAHRAPQQGRRPGPRRQRDRAGERGPQGRALAARLPARPRRLRGDLQRRRLPRPAEPARPPRRRSSPSRPAASTATGTTAPTATGTTG